MITYILLILVITEIDVHDFSQQALIAFLLENNFAILFVTLVQL